MEASGRDMTLDSSAVWSLNPLHPDTDGLLSLALDAYLVGHEQVARELAALADHLVEMRDCAALRAVAKEILARANAPGQGFATLLDAFDLSGFRANPLQMSERE
jgi:hypothetical protein